jgi:predicted CXXCH cytochrome family protein
MKNMVAACCGSKRHPATHSLFYRLLPALLSAFLFGPASPTVLCATSPPSANRDTVCAKCHQAIYESYEKTPMARASGDAADGLLPGEFTHLQSGVHYRLSLKDGRAWLNYDRPNPSLGRSLNGEQELEYFVGSGQRGRTYLFQNRGFWFESPVNWYSKQRVWDMNPKSLYVTQMPFTLKVDSGCLHCHASAVQPVLSGASNHFGEKPFLYGGITCESCHGDATDHVARDGKNSVLNPAKLPASRRDSICLQCHLEGETAVNRVGHSLSDFMPGEELSDYVTHFVHAGELGPQGRATSQWEALLQSECKQKSGNRMTCTTCHDPHSSPVPEKRVSYYRGKCLACHGQPSFVSEHHPNEPDCAYCHMPRKKAENVAHEQLTDHRIQRPFALSSRPVAAKSVDLMVVGGAVVGERDLGLAYFQFVKYGDQQTGQRAMVLLNQAERSNHGQPDSDLHTALGFLEHLSGNLQAAMLEYQAALQVDPSNSVAAGDLAILDARAADTDDAIALLQEVSQNDPGETSGSFDLAMVECTIGDSQSAVKTLRHLLEFSPDDGKARQTLAAIENKSQHCGP